MKKAVLFNLWGVVVTPHLDQTFQKFEETIGLSRYVTIICFVLCNTFVFIIYSIYLLLVFLVSIMSSFVSRFG